MFAGNKPNPPSPEQRTAQQHQPKPKTARRRWAWPWIRRTTAERWLDAARSAGAERQRLEDELVYSPLREEIARLHESVKVLTERIIATTYKRNPRELERYEVTISFNADSVAGLPSRTIKDIALAAGWKVTQEISTSKFVASSKMTAAEREQSVLQQLLEHDDDRSVPL